MNYQVYKDKKGEWRWRLVSLKNGKTVADSAEGYKTKAGVLRAIKTVSDTLVSKIEFV